MTPEELKAIRANLGLSQSELARLMGASVKAVQAWEQRVRPIQGTVEEQILWLKRGRLPRKPWGRKKNVRG